MENFLINCVTNSIQGLFSMGVVSQVLICGNKNAAYLQTLLPGH